MSEMVERCARAAAAVDNSLWVGEDADGYFEKVARAVIKEMREPTVEMVRAGRIELGKDDVGEIVYLQAGEVVEVWQPMIDEALK